MTEGIWPTVLLGDCREVLKTLPDDSVHCAVSSPPYWGLRDYGVEGQIGLEESPESHVSALVGVFGEVKRVLRPDGTLWLNYGDAYASSWPCSRRNVIGAASLPNGKREARPARLGGDLKEKDLIGLPWLLAFALRADGWYLRCDIIWAKPNPMPESVTDRPTRAHEYLFLLSKQARYYYDADAIREPAEYGRRKWSKQQFKEGDITVGHGKNGGSVTGSNPSAGRNRRSVWAIPSQPTKEAHFACFPEKLVEPCILAGCPEGGIVLDPFAGSGTVGRVATRLGRKSILIDLNGDYLKIIARRIAQGGLGL